MIFTKKPKSVFKNMMKFKLSSKKEEFKQEIKTEIVKTSKRIKQEQRSQLGGACIIEEN